jgi:hypothetical protein
MDAPWLLVAVFLLIMSPVIAAVVYIVRDNASARILRDRASAVPADNRTSQVARLVASDPATLVRTYHGKQQGDAVLAFETEAEAFAQYGYIPTSQSWASGQWGSSAFILALLLAIVLIGILIFLYLLVVKPEGTLTVVYARQAPTQTRTEPTPMPEPPTARDLSTRLAQLDAARQAGLITEDEYVAKRAAILDNL